MRQDVSLLRAEGHGLPQRYTLATLWYEAQLARERINAKIATEATLVHAVIAAVLTPKGKGVSNLKTLLKRLQDGR